MRLSAKLKSMNCGVEFRRADSLQSVDPSNFRQDDAIYASSIFTRTKPVIDALLRGRPDAVVGGTGFDVDVTLEKLGITDQTLDYSIYPNERRSIGFTQRGCRLRCPFCVVPRKEGAISQAVGSIYEIWRGDPYPRELLLLDNDFFGQPQWRERIAEIREGKFKVSFNQGINARFLTDEAAEALGSINCRDDDMKTRRIYTAWDNRKDEKRLFDGLNLLVKHGFKPDHIMVYMLIGYWPDETTEDREYRRMRLREFGARPYPMAYITADTPPNLAKELRGFQRWVIRRGDLKCPWSDFKKAGYRPEKVGMIYA